MTLGLHSGLLFFRSLGTLIFAQNLQRWKIISHYNLTVKVLFNKNHSVYYLTLIRL